MTRKCGNSRPGT